MIYVRYFILIREDAFNGKCNINNIMHVRGSYGYKDKVLDHYKKIIISQSANVG